MPGFSSDLGKTAWLYNGSATVKVGLTDAEHTRNDGLKYGGALELTESGYVCGYSNRYNGGIGFLGPSAWLYNGSATLKIGLTGAEHTRSNGWKESYAHELTESGCVRGISFRYTGSSFMGVTAWFYDGSATLNIGLTGPEHTRNDGYRTGGTRELTEAGYVSGYSFRYNGGSSYLGQSAWLYNGSATLNIGLTDPEHTRNVGSRSSEPLGLTESGYANGWSSRYNGGSSDLGRSAWLYNGSATLNIGLTDPEHTRDDGYRASYPQQLTESGHVRGASLRYNGGSSDLGRSAWLYNGSATVNIGLAAPEHTRDDGYRYSYPQQITESGYVSGYSRRYNGGSSDLGRSAWLYNGWATVNIGLTDPEHTRDDGYRHSSAGVTESGYAIGLSSRYNGGSSNLGQTAWLYNGSATLNIGLTDAMHTRDDGYRSSGTRKLTDTGYVSGYSLRYNGGSSGLGQSGWLYDPTLDETFPLVLSERSDGYAYSEVQFVGEDGLTLGNYTLFDSEDNELGDRAFYFTSAGGLHDLGGLVDGGLAATGWSYLAEPIGAIGNEQIVGQGMLLSQTDGMFAYLLTPQPQEPVIPEPTTLGLMGLGLLSLLRRRRPR